MIIDGPMAAIDTIPSAHKCLAIATLHLNEVLV